MLVVVRARQCSRSSLEKYQTDFDLATVDVKVRVGTMLRHTLRPLMRRPVSFIDFV